MIQFEHSADRFYFEKMLLHDDLQDLLHFKEMFDFRPAAIKRKEFNKIRNQRLKTLQKKHGLTCMLNFEGCDLESGIAVDHLIPIASNVLNKTLRNLKAEKGRKVKAQSFGSNHLDNLIIACSYCNNHKKHRLLDREKMISILKEKK